MFDLTAWVVISLRYSLYITSYQNSQTTSLAESTFSNKEGSDGSSLNLIEGHYTNEGVVPSSMISEELLGIGQWEYESTSSSDKNNNNKPDLLSGISSNNTTQFFCASDDCYYSSAVDWLLKDQNQSVQHRLWVTANNDGFTENSNKMF